jgi:hypothetical protein
MAALLAFLLSSPTTSQHIDARLNQADAGTGHITRIHCELMWDADGGVRIYQCVPESV